MNAGSSLAWNTSQNIPSTLRTGFFGSIFADNETLLCSIRCPYDEDQHINLVGNRASGTFSTFDDEHWYQVLYKAPKTIPETVE